MISTREQVWEICPTSVRTPQLEKYGAPLRFDRRNSLAEIIGVARLQRLRCGILFTAKDRRGMVRPFRHFAVKGAALRS